MRRQKSYCLIIVWACMNISHGHGVVTNPENIFCVIAILYSHWLIYSYDCWGQMRVQYLYDVEYSYIFGLWNRSMGDFSSYACIGANDSEASRFFYSCMYKLWPVEPMNDIDVPFLYIWPIFSAVSICCQMRL